MAGTDSAVHLMAQIAAANAAGLAHTTNALKADDLRDLIKQATDTLMLCQMIEDISGGRLRPEEHARLDMVWAAAEDRLAHATQMRAKYVGGGSDV